MRQPILAQSVLLVAVIKGGQGLGLFRHFLVSFG
jgi:hypothetical protein